MTVGQNIRALRKKRGLTQEQLGRLCGIRGAAISGYERGDTLPKKKVLDQLAEALDAPLSSLTGETAPPQRGESAGPLFNGILELLQEACGPVEEKLLTGGGGKQARYYHAGPASGGFTLHERDIAAMAQAAEASILPLIEGIRVRQRLDLEKLG